MQADASQRAHPIRLCLRALALAFCRRTCAVWPCARRSGPADWALVRRARLAHVDWRNRCSCCSMAAHTPPRTRTSHAPTCAAARRVRPGREAERNRSRTATVKATDLNAQTQQQRARQVHAAERSISYASPDAIKSSSCVISSGAVPLHLPTLREDNFSLSPRHLTLVQCVECVDQPHAHANVLRHQEHVCSHTQSRMQQSASRVN